ncbi:MAG: PDZ domain-containing protein [Chloroflexi bacterium]|nr:MAG: PDZ domain-containing protein [Chloroflexota bacterium]
MSEYLENVSNALSEVIETVAPFIVRVEARRRLPATGVVWSTKNDQSFIVTAHHVVEFDEGITIGLEDGTFLEAELIGRAPHLDLALLRVDAALPVPQWVKTDKLKVGHLALALGRPLAQVQAALGVISYIYTEDKRKHGDHSHEHHGRHKRHRRGRRFGRFMRMSSHFRADVVMYPGFSGGPLVTASGEIAGMNTSGFRGASITIPTQAIEQVVNALMTHGKMRRGYLGVGAQPARLPEALAAELEQETGLLIVSIEADSPAAESGLLVGDIIVALDDESITDLDELLALLTDDRIGKQAELTIVRGGQQTTVNVTIGERP